MLSVVLFLPLVTTLCWQSRLQPSELLCLPAPKRPSLLGDWLLSSATSHSGRKGVFLSCCLEGLGAGKEAGDSPPHLAREAGSSLAMGMEDQLCY